MKKLDYFYHQIVLRNPAVTLLAAALLIFFFGFHASDFRLDASADSLVLENDQSLRYYREIQRDYASEEYLFVTYTPVQDLFNPQILNNLNQLQKQLEELDQVSSVVSILNVPLINSPPLSLSDLEAGLPTLLSPKADQKLARQEFISSPLYKDLLMSQDGTTTAMQVNLHSDPSYRKLVEERTQLRQQRQDETLTTPQRERLKQLEIEVKLKNEELQARQNETINAVRAVLDQHRTHAKLHLGGVPMIANDSLQFVRHDLTTFGAGVLIFILLILIVIFRKPRWILLPILTCFGTIIIMTGFLGIMNWPVTVISSNFISLLLIITLSLTVHLIVRYRELHQKNPQLSQRELVTETVRSKALACIYTAITTIVAFGSLIISEIRPVIDFGIMMAIGTGVALILTFTLFPAVLMLMKPPALSSSESHLTEKITGWLSLWVGKHQSTSLMLFLILAAFTITGMTQLKVENSFINYYKPDTEIYQGMALIDQKLGGTTPLEVIIDAPKKPENSVQTTSSEENLEIIEIKEELDELDLLLAELDADPLETIGDDDLAFLEELEELDEISSIENSVPENNLVQNSYWFNQFRLEDVAKIHRYLDDLDETGKVLSLATTMALVTDLNQGKPADDLLLALLHKKLPPEVKKALIDPYLSADGNQLRFMIRVYDSDPDLQRNVLLQKIRTDLVEKFNLQPEQVHVTGMLELYNNMLQSLFRSQILTLGFVFLAILGMFILLFRNLKMAVLTIIPNILAACSVLGLMGILGIPLDMMTITIAAIAIGIAVDNAIHYVDRLRREFPKDRDYWHTIQRSHQSIGQAMYYTSLIIVLGFSILALSNFIPTIYFGLLTGLSMAIALLANLILLPLLFAKTKALG